METFYFGNAGDELFGAYWQPVVGNVAARAVVIANPLGQEYMRTHRALNRLAALLAQSGCHVLRFDYFGCGDSLGSGVEVSIARCRRDIAVAREELEQISGCERISLLGVRLGANLVLEGSAGTASLILWDPIPNGRKLIATLWRTNRAMHRDVHRFARPRRPLPDRPELLLGHPYSDSLLEEIAGIDLGAVEPGDKPDIYLMASGASRAQAEFRSFCEGAAERISEIETEEAYWDDLSTLEVALLPVAAFQTLARKLGG